MDTPSDLIPERTNSPVIYMGPNRITYLLTGEQTGGKFSLTEFAQAPAPAPPPPLHIHRDADETLYILDGQFDGFRIHSADASAMSFRAIV